jgi:hypothetical protein
MSIADLAAAPVRAGGFAFLGVVCIKFAAHPLRGIHGVSLQNVETFRA